MAIDSLQINWTFLDSVKNIHHLDTTESNVPYSLFYTGDGECSACVATLIESMRAVKQDEANQPLRQIIVMKAYDEYLIEHYFKQLNITLGPQDYLLVDRNSVFQRFNNFISTDMEMFLVDSEGSIISIGSPFTNKEIYNLYVAKGIFKKKQTD